MRFLRSRSRPRGGFTMIEMMVVVAIVAILAAIAIPIYERNIKYSRVSEATSHIGEIATAARAWAVEHPNKKGDPVWPSGEDGLVDLTNSPNFNYSLTKGRGANASSKALQITARGRNKTPMAGVRVDVLIPDISSNAEAPHITGF